MSDPIPDRMAQATPFWRFSLTFYGRPGIAEVLLKLQDGLGIDVNLILFVLWLASEGRLLAHEDMRTIGERSRGWQIAVVAPLRDVRRALKNNPPLVAPRLAEPFRSRIKAIELEAEHLQQDALYALAQELPPGEKTAPEAAARGNLEIFAGFANRALPPPSVEALLASFRDVVQKGR